MMHSLGKQACEVINSVDISVFGTCWYKKVRPVWSQSTQMSPNQWWCGDTRIVLWSRRCRSWSRGWWVSGRYSAQCYCGLMRAGFSSRPCVNPSSTSWWFARPAAAHSPPCGWKHTECGAFVAHWDPHLRDRKHNESELAAECVSRNEKHWTGGVMTGMVFPTYMSGF